MSIWDDLEKHVAEAPEYSKAGRRAEYLLHIAAMGRAMEKELTEVIEKNAVLIDQLETGRCRFCELHFKESEKVNEALEKARALSGACEGFCDFSGAEPTCPLHKK